MRLRERARAKAAGLKGLLDTPRVSLLARRRGEEGAPLPPPRASRAGVRRCIAGAPGPREGLERPRRHLRDTCAVASAAASRRGPRHLATGSAAGRVGGRSVCRAAHYQASRGGRGRGSHRGAIVSGGRSLATRPPPAAPRLPTKKRRAEKRNSFGGGGQAGVGRRRGDGGRSAARESHRQRRARTRHAAQPRSVTSPQPRSQPARSSCANNRRSPAGCRSPPQTAPAREPHVNRSLTLPQPPPHADQPRTLQVLCDLIYAQIIYDMAEKRQLFPLACAAIARPRPPLPRGIGRTLRPLPIAK